MNTLTSTASLHPTAPPSPGHRARQAAGALGAAWNLFGIVQFVHTLRATPASLMSGGWTAEQAAVYLALPGWMQLAFAVGVFGGLAGSIALTMQRRAALPLLAVSLAAYVLLFAGDAWFGLFAAFPAQLPVLVLVLAIAAVLFGLAVHARRSGGLR